MEASEEDATPIQDLVQVGHLGLVLQTLGDLLALVAVHQEEASAEDFPVVEDLQAEAVLAENFKE